MKDSRDASPRSLFVASDRSLILAVQKPLPFWCSFAFETLVFILACIYLEPRIKTMSQGLLVNALVITGLVILGASVQMKYIRSLYEHRFGVHLPPASQTLSILRTVFREKEYNAIFLPTVLDHREEHAEALARGDKGRARYLSALLWWTLMITLLSWIATNVIKRVISIWKIG